MPDVGVVHLVRAANGLEPARRFLASYLENRAGTGHELIVVFKGFGPEGPGPEYREIFAEVPHRSMTVDDMGFDIGAYLATARTCSNRFLCFLNSFSVILAENWLRHMHDLVSRPDVGLVGASGSWESPYSNQASSQEAASSWLTYLGCAVARVRLKPHFDRFPNPHIRTNGFMIERERFLVSCRRPPSTKMDAYRFESGKRSLTQTIIRMGLKPLVVGRDGRGYEKDEWRRSETFRAGAQENLLVADNQTIAFGAADPAVRGELSRCTWGEAAAER